MRLRAAAKNIRHLVDARYLSFIALKRERPVLDEREETPACPFADISRSYKVVSQLRDA